MKKLIVIPVLFFVCAVFSFAQAVEPNASQIGVDTAQQRLKVISINKFEDPGFWKVSIPLDQGIISHRKFEGKRSAVENETPLEEEKNGIKEEDKYVLGMKAQFFGRTTTSLSLEPVRPIAVPGITKTISIWAVGRNFNHVLKVVIQDYAGKRIVLPMGKLNYSGWKKLTVAVPPGVEQKNPHFTNQVGIKILGFVVEPDMTETYGTYFVYFDDLRVETDLFSEEDRDPDDIVDNW